MSLYATPHRKAFLRAVNERGRVYRNRAEKTAYDSVANLVVTARVAEAFQAGWIEPVPEEDLWPKAWSFLTYYRLTAEGQKLIEEKRNG